MLFDYTRKGLWRKVLRAIKSYGDLKERTILHSNLVICFLKGKPSCQKKIYLVTNAVNQLACDGVKVSDMPP